MSSFQMYFDTNFSYQKSVLILQELSKKLLSRLTNADHDLHALIDNHRYTDIINYDIRYGDLSNPYDVYIVRQVLALYQKSVWIESDHDPRQVALESFSLAEDQCLATNKRIRYSSKRDYDRLDAPLYFKVMRKIAEILGPCPELDELDFGFGPGANVGVSRLTSTRRKLSVSPTCTASASKYIPYLIETHPHWSSLLQCEPVRGGRLAFVPKNRKTDRCIVIEPLINTYLQKGVGSFIRDRLKRFGCNLNSQVRNQEGAKIGSIDNTLCTVDLKSASDTISREVVAALLPHDWWSLLNDIRTEEVELPSGEFTRLKKFSSMGNGFTFELESLIFFAICKVICEKDEFVSVYGDDIVIPTNRFDELIWAIKEFGFTVNTEKSFSDGPFRESCGKDFFGGVDVRPCYVKSELSPKEIYRLHNYFVRHDEGDLAEFLLTYLPKRLRHFGPDGLGDGHLLWSYPFVKPKVYKKRSGYSGYVIRSFATKPFERNEPLKGDYPAFLYYTTKAQDDHLDVCMQAPEPKDIQSSQSMYFERSSKPRYRLRRLYVLG